jgi:hypothetical protein
MTFQKSGYNMGRNNPNWKGGHFINCVCCGKQIWKSPWEKDKKFCSFLCMGEEMRFHLKNPKINKDFAYIYGAVLGDGSYFHNKSGEGYGITLGVKDKDFILKFKKSMELWSNKKNINLRYNEKDECYYINVMSVEIYNFFQKQNFKHIIKLSKNIQRSFFEGVFDAEGCISEKFIIIEMCNKELIEILSYILELFGINSRIRISHKKGDLTNYGKYNNDSYRLEVCGQKNLILFYKNFKISISYKQLRLKEEIKSYLKKPYKNEKVIVKNLKYIKEVCL